MGVWKTLTTKFSPVILWRTWCTVANAPRPSVRTVTYWSITRNGYERLGLLVLQRRPRVMVLTQSQHW